MYCMCVRVYACETLCVSKGVRGSFSLSVCTFYRLYLFIYLFFPEEKKMCVWRCVCVYGRVCEWSLKYSKKLILSLEIKLR